MRPCCLCAVVINFCRNVTDHSSTCTHDHQLHLAYSSYTHYFSHLKLAPTTVTAVPMTAATNQCHTLKADHSSGYREFPNFASLISSISSIRHQFDSLLSTDKNEEWMKPTNQRPTPDFLSTFTIQRLLLNSMTLFAFPNLSSFPDKW